MSVLSVNCFVMGHAAYQLSLEQGFREHVPELIFDSIHMPAANRSDLAGRIAYRIMTLRAPWCQASDWDWIRLRSELASSLFLRRLLERQIPVRKPDVLHVHTQSIALLSCDMLRRTPSVISMDCTSALLARIHPKPASRTYQPIVKLERACLMAASHIVCWSHKVRDSVIEDYGVDSKKVSVIRPAVVRPKLPARSSFEPSTRKFRLLFVGNDFARKGGYDLVEVFLSSLASTCELDMVSNGIDALPAHPGLRLHRGLHSLSPALLQLYADADLFVMPTYEDAFGIVYVEAMANGLPCIGSDVLAVPELVKHEVNGLTVRPGDRSQLRSAIERLRDDATLRRRFSDSGRAFAEQECDTATNCRKLASIFEGLAEAGVTAQHEASTAGSGHG